MLGLAARRALFNNTNGHLICFCRWLACGFQINLLMRKPRDTFYRYWFHFNQLLEECQKGSAAGPSRRRRSFIASTEQATTGPAEPMNVVGSTNHCKRMTSSMPTFPYGVPFTQYSVAEFDWNHQVRTTEWLAQRAGQTVLTNRAIYRIEDLYTRLAFHLTFLRAPKMITCTGERKPACKVLVTRSV